MIHTASAMTVRKNLGELLNEVRYRNDSIVITKTGKPTAAIINIELFEKLRDIKYQFRKLTAELGKTYFGVDPAVAEAEIEEAVLYARKRKG